MKFDQCCPKCKSRRVGHLDEKLDRTTPGKEKMPAALGEAETSGPFERGHVTAGELWGALECYMCADCGFMETYVKHPDVVPFEMLKGFRWVNPPPEQRGPFR